MILISGTRFACVLRSQIMSQTAASASKVIADLPSLEDAKDPEKSAQRAGLHYVHDDTPGISRRRAGKGFSYRDVGGKTIKDEEIRQRINKLAIPPAYQNVWICPDPDGHIQATGLDEKGRKQYRYHPRWNQVRDEAKFTRLIAFAQALPAIRERTDADLRKRTLSREKVLAALVQLLEKTAIRVGNEEYARQNETYGLTTMENRHVEVEGSTVHFEFTGKSHKDHEIDLKDKKLAAIVEQLQDLPGQSLFQFVDADGQTHSISSGDVNDYLHEIAGDNFTAKDFRTWAGTVAASLALQEFEEFSDKGTAAQNVVEAVKVVAQKLGNTPAVSRKSYIHPAVIEAYFDGDMLNSMQQKVEEELSENLQGLKPEEAAVLGLLQQKLAHTQKASKD